MQMKKILEWIIYHVKDAIKAHRKSNIFTLGSFNENDLPHHQSFSANITHVCSTNICRCQFNTAKIG